MKTLCVIALFVLGCSPPTAATAAGEHRTLEALKRAAAWPEPDVRTVGSLVTLFVASELDRQAYEYFSALQTETAEKQAGAWFLAASGLFQLRLADEVSLLRRIAWVREGMAKLDRAAAIEPGLPRYLRGAAFSQLPPRFEASDQAIRDLEWVLDHGDSFPPGIGRAALRYLASAHERAGRAELAGRLLRRSGHTRLDGSEPIFASAYAVTEADGFRFGHEEVRQAAPGVWLANGFDFTELAFVETSTGLVAIDAGTRPANAQAALAALRAHTQLPLSHLIVTHSHWDHIGGAAAMVGPDVEVIAQSHFDTAVERLRETSVPFRWFFGEAPIPLDLSPDRLVESEETLRVGDRTIELIPVAGGETEDALLVHVPESGTLFVGDAFMPYFGAPFVNEGNPAELLRVIDRILEKEPRLLLHGHRPLTENFRIEVLRPLRDALAELLRAVQAGLRAGRPETELLGVNILPDLLREAPDAVLPYLIMRDHFIKRSYDLQRGYWRADGTGIEEIVDGDWARALDLLGGGASGYERTAEALLASGEAVLPFRLASLGLQNHPRSQELRALRDRALQRLRAKNQVLNPFKFIIYSERLRAELPMIDPDDLRLREPR